MWILLKSSVKGGEEMNMNFEELDELEIINIFKYFDFPYVFVSKSLGDKYYFNYYIEPLDDGTDKWLFSEISNVERLDILGQRISMLELLNKLKENMRLKHLYITPQDDGNCVIKFETVNAYNFDPESFPVKDYYAEYDYQTDTELKRVEEEVVEASRFKLVLKDRNNNHDIGLDLLVAILSNFKKSLKGIATDLGLDNECVDLKVDSLQPSSFGVYLKSEDDIFNTSGKTLGKMFELIERINTNTEEKMADIIENDVYSMSTIKEVNELLKDIKKNDYTLAFQSKVRKDGTPVEVIFERTSYSKVDTISNILLRTNTNEEELNITGTLTSINSINNGFSIKSSDETKFKGIMVKELFEKVKYQEISFKVPAEIEAVIIKETKYNVQNGTEQVKYRLKKFTQNDATLIVQ